MVTFRSLFSFSRSEVSEAFAQARLYKKIYGLTLLALPATTPHGKLLIVTPRAMGKAHERNLLRRRLKAIYFEHALYDVPMVVIVIAYKAANKITFEQLTKFLTTSIRSLPVSSTPTS